MISNNQYNSLSSNFGIENRDKFKCESCNEQSARCVLCLFEKILPVVETYGKGRKIGFFEGFSEFEKKIFLLFSRLYKKILRQKMGLQPFKYFKIWVYPPKKWSEGYLEILPFTEFFEILSEFNNIKENQRKEVLSKRLRNSIQNSDLSLFMLKKYGFIDFSLEFILNLFPSFNQFKKEIAVNEVNPSGVLIDTYLIFNQYYRIKIHRNIDSIEMVYSLVPNLEVKFDILESKLMSFIQKKTSSGVFNNSFCIEKKIKLYADQIYYVLINYFSEYNSKVLHKLAWLYTLRMLKLNKIIPFLLDEFIEEIFLDSSESYIYLNHNKFGRCRTTIQISEEEKNALITHLRLESNKRFDRAYPSLTHTIQNCYFNCRFSLDLSPFHWKNFSFAIRRMNKSLFNLVDLQVLKTLNMEIIVFLIFCVLMRINLTLIGEVNSGKTTLMNAIDLVVPGYYRRIYVEENIETNDFSEEKSHQLKFRVSDDNDSAKSVKAQAIYKLLHRSGDLIILGEILSKEDTHAFFHCLSVGLKGFQTTHASSIKSLINRWVVHFEIDKNCLNDLGILILMRKIGGDRKIISIANLDYNNKGGDISINYLFKYNPILMKWVQDVSFVQTRFFSSICEIIPFSEEIYMNITSKIRLYLQSHNGDPQIFHSESINHFFNELKNEYPFLGGI